MSARAAVTGTALALVAGVSSARSAAPTNPPLRITFLALERGESTLIQAPGGMVGLVGAGAPGEGAQVMRFLKSRGIRQIDTLMLAAWSDRQMGGIPELLKRFPVKMFMRTPLYARTSLGDRILRLADSLQQAHRVNVVLPTPGESTAVFFQPPCEFIAVAPTGPMLERFKGDRDCSLVMEVSYDKVSYLTLGTTTSRHQEVFWKQVRQKPWGHILQIGRDGAADALAASLLRPLKTRVAVLSIPKRAHGRPSPTLLAALRRNGVRLYRTDRQGNITVTTDGENIDVKTER